MVEEPSHIMEDPWNNDLSTLFWRGLHNLGNQYQTLTMSWKRAAGKYVYLHIHEIQTMQDAKIPHLRNYLLVGV